MAVRKKDNQINLLPVDRLEGTTLGRTLGWLLGTFRYIVIVVEIIVIFAFLSRFWLDAKNSDLNDEIKQKQSLIEASASFENEYRNIQNRLEVFTTLTSKSYLPSEIIGFITPQLPPDVFLASINIGEVEINVSGSSPSERSIAQFIANLESVENIESVTLTQLDVDKEGEGLLSFILGITLK